MTLGLNWKRTESYPGWNGGKVDLATFLSKQNNYTVINGEYKQFFDVYYKNTCVGRIFKKYDFYNFLKEFDIDWRTIISSQLLPDDSKKILCLFWSTNFKKLVLL